MVTNIRNALSVALVAAAAVSCNRNESKDMYTPLGYALQYDVKSQNVRWVKITPEERREYNIYKIYLVNSVEELPEDKIFGVEEFRLADIDFRKYSLILSYHVVPGYAIGHKYYWSYNNFDDCYEFSVHYSTVEDSEHKDTADEMFTYVRNAILVNHIPSSSSLQSTMSAY